jgi:ubiquitin
MRRQGEALARVECYETGDELLRQAAIADADRDRAEWGLPPLKTEVEFHRKAVERGLICR